VRISTWSIPVGVIFLATLLGGDHFARAAETSVGPRGRAVLAKLADAVKDTDFLSLDSAITPVARMGLRIQALPILIAGLKTGPVEFRESLARSIGETRPTRPKAVTALFELLNDPDGGVRDAAVEALQRVDSSAIPMLSKALSHRDVRLRRAAVTALYHIASSHIGVPGKKTVVALTAALNDRDAKTRTMAAFSLGAIGPLAGSAVPTLIQALGDRKRLAPEMITIVEDLGKIGPGARAAIPALRRIMLSDAPGLMTAPVSLGQIGGPSAIEALKQGLSHKDSSVRSEAANALILIGPPAKSAVPLLVKRLKDTDLQTRVNAAVALWAIDGQIKNGIPIFTQGLKTSPKFAADSIARIGPAAKGTIPALLDVLRSSDDLWVRLRAASALGTMGGAARSAIPSLEVMLNSKKSKKVTVLASPFEIFPACPGIGKPAVPLLIRALSNTDTEVRRQAVSTLAEMADEAVSAIPSLLPLLKDADKRVREEAGFALAQIIFSRAGTDSLPAVLSSIRQDEQTKKVFTAMMRLRGIDVSGDTGKKFIAAAKALIPRFMRGLKSSNSSTRERAIDELRRLGPYAKQTLPDLRGLLDSEDLVIRFHAAAAVLAINAPGKNSLSILVRALKHPDESFRTTAARLLGEVGPAAGDAVGPLRAAFQDSDPLVRLTAVEALTKIAPADRTVIPALVALLDARVNLNIREMAVDTLAKQGPRAVTALPALRRLQIGLRPSFRSIRIKAANAIRRIQEQTPSR